LAPVSWYDVVVESGEFLLNVVRAKIGVAGWLDSQSVSSESIARVGPVLLTKSVLMPVRLLYVLRLSNDDRIVVSTDEAAQACDERYGDRPWWELVSAARAWRDVPPDTGELRLRAAKLLEKHLRSMYVDCVGEYSAVLGELGETALCGRLSSWRNDLSSPE
jgi:hypothetical protein